MEEEKYLVYQKRELYFLCLAKSFAGDEKDVIERNVIRDKAIKICKKRNTLSALIKDYFKQFLS